MFSALAVVCAILHPCGSTASAIGWKGSKSIEYNPTNHDFLEQSLYGRAYGSTWGADAWSTTMWYFDGATTRRVGFFGETPAAPGSPSHTSEEGYENSGSEATLSNIDIFHDEIFAPKIAASGLVAGYSIRYYGGDLEGKSVWVFHPSTGITQRIGYYAGHEPAGMASGYSHAALNGMEKSEITGVNPAGKVIGFSWYFSGDDYRNYTGWLFENGVMKRIGLFEKSCPEVLYHGDCPLYINERGQVSGNTSCGPWLYDGSSNIRIGFNNREGTVHPAIYHVGGEVQAMNNDGRVIGVSKQKSDNASPNWVGGQTAWIYNGIDTQRDGLYSDEYISWTENRGFSNSYPLFISPDGQAVGLSHRVTPAGHSTWHYNKTSSQRIGFFNEEPASATVFTHTASTGEETSSLVAIAQGGKTIGSSTRYRSAATHGSSAWYFDGAKSTRIGFFSGHDPLAGNTVTHTRSDGYEYSRAMKINSSGTAVGVSYRYSGGAYLGETGWFYDPVSGTSHMLVASQSQGGSAVIKPQILTEAGEVYGAFRKYDGYADKGWRLFYWTLKGGFRDISEEAGGLLTDCQWTTWSSVLGVSNVDKDGNLIGSGYCITEPGGSVGRYTPFIVHTCPSCGPGMKSFPWLPLLLE